MNDRIISPAIKEKQIGLVRNQSPVILKRIIRDKKQLTGYRNFLTASTCRTKIGKWFPGD